MFYRVMKTYEGHPDPHQYGYETHNDLVTSIRRLITQYGGMTGECLATNKAQLLLRFRNRHGGLIGQAWIYHFMLQAAPIYNLQLVRRYPSRAAAHAIY